MDDTNEDEVMSMDENEENEDDDIDENEEGDETEENEEGDEIEENDGAEGNVQRVYMPGKDAVKGKLEGDMSAYVMYHQAKTMAPCLSFDVVKDGLGEERSEFPHSMYIVAGTQPAKSKTSHVIVMKMSNLHKVKVDEDDDDDEESSDEEEEENELPELTSALIKHEGCVNRIRVSELGNRSLAATWSEFGNVNIWDITPALQAVDNFQKLQKFQQSSENIKPLFSFSGHLKEGYAIDWSKLVPGQLATGDCNKNIHLWKSKEGCQWSVDQRPFVGHTSSVEDIQWSPSEANVFSSCSSDRSIRVWDARVAPNKACMLTVSDAHENDINVINWNKSDPFIVSGGDDGVIKIWDLRQFTPSGSKSVAAFKHHFSAITSVEWHPIDSTVFAASGSDDQLTIWDLAVEADDDETTKDLDENIKNVPPQLLFIHQGQSDIKELHWHPQIPGTLISTAQSGFNIFKTISV